MEDGEQDVRESGTEDTSHLLEAKANSKEGIFNLRVGVCIHWIASLEWTTGLEHWTIQIMFIFVITKLSNSGRSNYYIINLDHAHFIIGHAIAHSLLHVAGVVYFLAFYIAYFSCFLLSDNG